MNAAERTRGDAHLFRFPPPPPPPPPPSPSANQPPLHRELQLVTPATPNSQREFVRSFQFDLCASEQLSQAQFFRSSGVESLLDAVVEGYLATVFAYGQTGSGKTYSMSGTDELLSDASCNKSSAIASSSAAPDESDGVIPRALRYLFESFRRAPRGTTFLVRASYCEIYNEHVYDLLNPSSGSLHVRFSDRSGFYVQNLLVVQCDSLDDVFAVVREGHRNRRVGSHDMNKDSSRSHSLLTVHIDRVTRETGASDGGQATTTTKFGKVSFVDLAGSERLKETRSTNAEETSSINKSLLTLGKVISALSSASSASSAVSSPQTSAFIPYRDSKLTMLLMDSLGGSSLTLMIACVSPSAAALDDSLSTLNYATRAKNIQNRPAMQVDPVEFALSTLRAENKALRAENDALRRRLSAAEPASEPTDALSASTTGSRSLLPPIYARNDSGRPSLSGKYPRQDPSQHSPTRSSPSKTSANAHRNQQTELRDENAMLMKQLTATDQQVQRLRAENDMLRCQHSQQSIQDGLSVAVGAAQATGVHPELERLRQQVQQLQQREQELMQALARRSRVNRDSLT